MELLEHNLHLLPIGRALRDEMKTLYNTNQPFFPSSPIEQRNMMYLGILHLIRGIGFKKMRHLGRFGYDIQSSDLVNWCSDSEM